MRRSLGLREQRALAPAVNVPSWGLMSDSQGGIIERGEAWGWKHPKQHVHLKLSVFHQRQSQIILHPGRRSAFYSITNLQDWITKPLLSWPTFLC
jgi:hypothetical protein